MHAWCVRPLCSPSQWFRVELSRSVPHHACMGRGITGGSGAAKSPDASKPAQRRP